MRCASSPSVECHRRRRHGRPDVLRCHPEAYGQSIGGLGELFSVRLVHFARLWHSTTYESSSCGMHDQRGGTHITETHRWLRVAPMVRRRNPADSVQGGFQVVLGRGQAVVPVADGQLRRGWTFAASHAGNQQAVALPLEEGPWYHDPSGYHCLQGELRQGSSSCRRHAGEHLAPPGVMVQVLPRPPHEVAQH